jgi:nicotinamide-nucleotide amidase
MAERGMDLIVTSGGLGPTADDLTAEIVARFTGRELVLDEEMEGKIAAILRGFARRFKFDEEAVMAANRKQAMVPEGAIPLDPVGTAPGLVVPAEERVFVVLPGPPRELRPMWPAALESPPVRELLGRATPLRGYTLRLFGIPESEIAKSLREMEAAGVALSEVEIITCLRRGEIEIDVRYRDGAEATADAVRSRSCWAGTGWGWRSPAAAACWRRGSRTSPAPPSTWRAAWSPTPTRPRPSCWGWTPV